jgi:hypothetical protein
MGIKKPPLTIIVGISLVPYPVQYEVWQRITSGWILVDHYRLKWRALKLAKELIEAGHTMNVVKVTRQYVGQHGR